jgi:nicotinamide phosphoribosyltransferase
VRLNPLLMIDGYKTDHRPQYPLGTEFVMSNWTGRKSRLEGVDFYVFFGLQYFVKEYLIKRFEEDFFSLPRDYVLGKYKKRLDQYLGGYFSVEHIGELWDLGHLPIEINSVPEGTKVPIGVAGFTIIDTDGRFFWLTNQLETILSCTIWQPCTSATIAHMYRKEFEAAADRTGLEKWFIEYQGHDFSFRGMSSFESACMSGAAHLLSFKGTDTLPAIDFIEEYYQGNGTEGTSVPASEHSVATLNVAEIEDSLRNKGEWNGYSLDRLLTREV